NVWRYTDSTFSAVMLAATFTYPANGTTNADLTKPIQWTPVPNVEAYTLTIGTSAGASDLVNTGALQQSSYLVTAALSTNRALYARLSTKVGGVWRSTDWNGRLVDISFSVGAPNTPTFVYPTDGTTTLDLTRSFEWTSVANVQAYVLYIGTSIGAYDLFN